MRLINIPQETHMTYNEINKTKWKHFFDSLSKLLNRREDADLKFISPSVGSQVIETGAAFTGVTYEPKDDELNLFFKDLGHTIKKPVRIVLGEVGTTLVSISIEDSDDQIHTIEFGEPIWMDFSLLRNPNPRFDSHDNSTLMT